MTEEKKEQEESKKETKIETLLEAGQYEMHGPENGDINIEKIILKSVTGAHRIWKVKSIDRKQIVLDVIKFG